MDLVIGLTGGIASGKTTVSDYIESKGYNVIDCDLISHEVLFLKDTITELVNEFGDSILVNDAICRKTLGDIVFNNKEKLNKLNNILHPIIYNEVKCRITKGIVFINCPLLFETNFISLCDKTAVIYVNRDIQVNRLIKRDNLTKEDAINRINLQISLDEKKKLADYVVDNSTDIKNLYKQTDNMLERINGD